MQIAGISQRIDPRIVEKVHGLVAEGVRDVSEMRRHINVYIQNSLFPGTAPPPKSNKRFHPSATTVKNHMYIAVIKQRLAKVDQSNLLERVKVWRQQNEGDFIEFRPYVHPAEREHADCDDENSIEDEDHEEVRVDDGTSNKGLLFVHQAKWQRRLLNRYGITSCASWTPPTGQRSTHCRSTSLL